MEKLIITAAITGGSSPQGNPHLPKSPKEQVQSAIDAWNAGASVIHIHGRNPETGEPDHVADYLGEAIAGIRQESDVIVNCTTGGTAHRMDLDWLYKEIPKESVKGRFQVIADLSRHADTKPDLASFNAGSPVIDIYSKGKDEFLLKFVMVHTFDDMRYGARVLKECGVKPEIECYDVGMINNAVLLKDAGDLEDPLYFDFVLGVIGQIPATVENVTHMYHSIPQGSPWSACAVGLAEWPVITTAILLGGNVRVGFEDNIYLSRGMPAKSNAEMVEKAVRIARELDREIASPEEARAMLRLPPRP
ncbi:MAG: 3-keto-5-aminohexanoate cleavage protein [Syntrophorhabdales bacterium]|jgi:3-keto-5-aminohexanoate cleavage enzyme